MFNDEKSPLNKNNKNFSPKTHSNTHTNTEGRKKNKHSGCLWLMRNKTQKNKKR